MIGVGMCIWHEATEDHAGILNEDGFGYWKCRSLDLGGWVETPLDIWAPIPFSSLIDTILGDTLQYFSITLIFVWRWSASRRPLPLDVAILPTDMMDVDFHVPFHCAQLAPVHLPGWDYTSITELVVRRLLTSIAHLLFLLQSCFPPTPYATGPP